MPDMSLSMSIDERSDDLPRTLRNRSLRTGEDTTASEREGVVVTDVRIPFFRLMLFCFKLMFAALPAIIVLAVVLHLMTEAVVRLYPDFRIWKNNLEYGRTAPGPLPAAAPAAKRP